MTRRPGSGRSARAANGPVTLSRLKRRSEFLAVAAARRRWVAPGLVLQARRRESDQASVPATITRYGITASRKVGNAVARNRAKRRLRAVAAEILPGAGAAGYDVVLIARAATVERPYAALRDDLAKGVAKLTARRSDAEPTELES